MKRKTGNFREQIDRIFAEQAGGYVPGYLLRLVALSCMIGAIAFEALYRFDDIFGGLSELLIFVSIIGFGFGAFFVALLVAYQCSEKTGTTVTRIHDRSW